MRVQNGGSVENLRAKIRTESTPVSARKLWLKINANYRRKLRIAHRCDITSSPRRIIDEIWRHNRKNEHRHAEKWILRKTTSRTDKIGPIFEKKYFWKKWVRSVEFVFYDAPASFDSISINHSGPVEFLTRTYHWCVGTERTADWRGEVR